jgi:hypothetical protein
MMTLYAQVFEVEWAHVYLEHWMAERGIYVRIQGCSNERSIK